MDRVTRMRAGCWGAALGCAIALLGSGAHARDLWGRLWMTAPQRAQQLLETGHPGEAAKLFKDPRRRAYAELRAGHDAQAAKLLKAFKDPRSQYNRGNALALAGHLKAALAAYDASLAKAPHDRDAIHNRNLVARALERRAGQMMGRGGSRGRPGHSGQNGKAGGASSRGARGAQSRGHGASQSGRFASATPGQSSGGSGTRAGRSGSDTESARQQAEQAREDARRALELERRAATESQQRRAGGTAARSGGSRGAAGLLGQLAKGHGGPNDVSAPLSEQALALQQWLRRIPDDPAGLLRREFLIKHLEREQREQEQQSGDVSGGSGP